jgi:hypothetical protein
MHNIPSDVFTTFIFALLTQQEQISLLVAFPELVANVKWTLLLYCDGNDNDNVDDIDFKSSIEKCWRCKCNIRFHKKVFKFRRLYKEKCYRRCANDKCNFIICGKCYNTTNDMWTGYQLPMDDNDYICVNCPQ